MLPPPPATTLREANPHFSLLYDHLVTNILNHDASTRSKAVEHDAVAGKLNEARKAILRDGILLRALEEVALSSEPLEPSTKTTNAGVRGQSQSQPDRTPVRLSAELKDLILNIVSYLSVSLDPETNRSLPTDTDELMTEELESFHHHLSEISRHLSQYLINTESNLASLATALLISQPTNSHPTSKPSTTATKRHEQHTTTSTTTHSLSASLTSLTDSNSTSQTSTLPTLLSSTTQSLHTLLTTHAQNLHSTIRTLELTTHGTSARHLTSRSTYLNAVSRGIEMKAQTLRLEHERASYTDTDEHLLDMLGDEYDALQSQERRLVKRERELRAVLQEYDTAGREAVVKTGLGFGGQQRAPAAAGNGEDVFRVLGARYAEIEGELEAVKADVERLEEVWLRPRESRVS